MYTQIDGWFFWGGLGIMFLGQTSKTYLTEEGHGGSSSCCLPSVGHRSYELSYDSGLIDIP